MPILAIIGLGNPGSRFRLTRHNIGFLVVDALAQQEGALWSSKDTLELAQISLNGQKVLLIKPQTFMNNSGDVLPFLRKKGITAEQMLVVHDELELEPGKIAFRRGGSARGHNGLRSLIAHGGEDFYRLRVGIGRPAEKSQVSSYVLEDFNLSSLDLQKLIDRAVEQVGEVVRMSL